MSNTLFPPIAVVGFSGVFPKATGGHDFWRNIVGKVDAAIDVPAERWIGPLDWVYSRTPKPDMAYSRRACLVDDFKIDPSGFQIDADLVQSLDPLHQWVLHASRDALKDCRADIDGRRIGIILAAIALPTDLSSEISRRCLGRRIFEPESIENSPCPV